MKINNIRGELTDISAKKEPLPRKAASKGHRASILFSWIGAAPKASPALLTRMSTSLMSSGNKDNVFDTAAKSRMSSWATATLTCGMHTTSDFCLAVSDQVSDMILHVQHYVVPNSG